MYTGTHTGVWMTCQRAVMFYLYFLRVKCEGWGFTKTSTQSRYLNVRLSQPYKELLLGRREKFSHILRADTGIEKAINVLNPNYLGGASVAQ